MIRQPALESCVRQSRTRLRLAQLFWCYCCLVHDPLVFFFPSAVASSPVLCGLSSHDALVARVYYGFNFQLVSIEDQSQGTPSMEPFVYIAKELPSQVCPYCHVERWVEPRCSSFPRFLFPLFVSWLDFQLVCVAAFLQCCLVRWSCFAECCFIR